MALTAVNLMLRVRKSDFRVFLHPPAAIDRTLRDAGFGAPQRQRTVLWTVAVYRRETATEAPAC
jgi:hypothetical protein